MAQSTSSDNNTMCTLCAKDGIQIPISLEVAKMSVTIKNMLEDLGDDDGFDNHIPIPPINGNVLKKIYEYCQYIYKNPLELDELQKWIDDYKFEVPLPAWFTEYLNIDQGLLVEIILGANFLDIDSLLRMACKQVASFIRNKTPEELKIIFNKQSEQSDEAVSVMPAAAAAAASVASASDETETIDENVDILNDD
jgi:S-phase kinase-associated protein 1